MLKVLEIQVNESKKLRGSGGTWPKYWLGKEYSLHSKKFISWILISNF